MGIMEMRILLLIIISVVLLSGCQSEAAIVEHKVASSVVTISDVRFNDDLFQWVEENVNEVGEYIYYFNDDSYILVVSEDLDDQNYVIKVDGSKLSEYQLKMNVSEVNKVSNDPEKVLGSIMMKADGYIEEVIIINE